MKLEIITKQETIPSFSPNAVAVKHIEYYPDGGTYNEKEITSSLISKILKEVPKEISIYLFLNPAGECDWLEVVSDGEWLFLNYCFESAENDGFENYYTYNPDFCHTANQIMEVNFFDFSDESVYTILNSGGQSPIPKIHAITDMEAGVKAVEFFIRTGARYPGIDWIHQL